MMVFLEQLSTKLSAIIWLKDGLTGKEPIGEVFLQAATRKPSVRNQLGCFLLLDLEGTCTVTAGGRFYTTIGDTINPAELEPDNPEKTITLQPNANYPFSNGWTVLRGRIITRGERKPLTGATFTVDGRVESAVTGDDGRYFIIFGETISSELPVTVRIQKDGFQTVETGLTIKRDTVNRFSIELESV